MGCHYCDSWAGRQLGEKVVCEDCYQTVRAVPGEDRVGALTERLQKVHGMLLKQPQQGYIAVWVGELAQRLEHISRLSKDPDAATDVPDVVYAPEPHVPHIEKLPKPLKIRKLR